MSTTENPQYSVNVTSFLPFNMSTVDTYTLPSSSLTQEEKIALLDAKFDSNTMSWGDYGYFIDSVIPNVTVANTVAVAVADKPNSANEIEDTVHQDILDQLDMYEREALENWTIPNITLRKGIWENFPVVLTPIDDGDGTDRYAVTWHRRNLAVWRNERPCSYDEHMEYEGFTQVRLEYTLAVYSHKYEVEDPRSEDQLCVIRMVHAPVEESTEAPTSAPAEESTKAPTSAPASEDDEGEFTPVPVRRTTRSTAPALTRLNDIKVYFPVVWRDVPSRNPHVKIYAIELFGKKIREMSATAGRDLTDEISSQLNAALRASNSWRVLRSEGREFCRIEMA